METKTSITEKTANNAKANVRRREKKLKLFVWEGVLTDYTSGVMFALATNVENARKQIMKKENGSTAKADLMSEPLVITKAEGFAVWGGG